MRPISKAVSRGLVLIPLLALPPLASRADVVTDWNLKAGEIIAAHQPGPPGSATLAVLQNAVRHEREFVALAARNPTLIERRAIPEVPSVAASGRGALKE